MTYMEVGRLLPFVMVRGSRFRECLVGFLLMMLFTLTDMLLQ